MADPAPAHLLVVCTANICRSPLAAALLEELVDHHGPAWARPLAVSSAGTHARPGWGAAEPMVRIGAEWGLDLSGHRSRPVSDQLTAAADLVVTMEAGQRDRVARMAPGLTVRTFTLRELADLVVHAAQPDSDGLTLDAGIAGLVRSLHRTRVAAARPAGDIVDPYGGPEDSYRRVADLLADLAGIVGPPLVTALASEH